MPIYEYVCQRCEKEIDVLQKVNDPAPEKCENCGAKGSMTRVVSRTSFILKGGGWYADLYGSPKKTETKTGDSKSDAKPGGEGSKPDGKAPTSSNGSSQQKSEKANTSADSAPASGSSGKSETTPAK